MTVIKFWQLFLFCSICADRGGDRVAWSKQWIASPDIWTFRANFDSRVRIKIVDVERKNCLQRGTLADFTEL